MESKEPRISRLDDSQIADLGSLIDSGAINAEKRDGETGVDVVKRIIETAKHANKISTDRQWKNAVKDRDGHACRKCKDRRNLHVHHIKLRSKFPEFALTIENGLTLCGNCHSELKGKEETKNLQVFLGGRDKKYRSATEGNRRKIL